MGSAIFELSASMLVCGLLFAHLLTWNQGQEEVIASALEQERSYLVCEREKVLKTNLLNGRRWLLTQSTHPSLHSPGEILANIAYRDCLSTRTSYQVIAFDQFTTDPHWPNRSIRYVTSQ